VEVVNVDNIMKSDTIYRINDKYEFDIKTHTVFCESNPIDDETELSALCNSIKDWPILAVNEKNDYIYLFQKDIVCKE